MYLYNATKAPKSKDLEHQQVGTITESLMVLKASRFSRGMLMAGLRWDCQGGSLA
jgi:hypothetical protein